MIVLPTFHSHVASDTTEIFMFPQYIKKIQHDNKNIIKNLTIADKVSIDILPFFADIADIAVPWK